MHHFSEAFNFFVRNVKIPCKIQTEFSPQNTTTKGWSPKDKAYILVWMWSILSSVYTHGFHEARTELSDGTASRPTNRWHTSEKKKIFRTLNKEWGKW